MEGSLGSEVGFVRRVRSAEKTDFNKNEISTDFHALDIEESEERYESDSTDLDEDFEPDIEQNNDIVEIYKKSCKQFKVVPCSPFIRKLRNDEIDIKHYNIGPKGALAVAKAMHFNTETTFLNLADNGIGSEGASGIAAMLRENCFITVLDLSMNFIQKDGVDAVCAMLSGNKHLLELSLASNRLGDASARLIADALRSNTALRMLNLSSNEIGIDADNGLASAIGTNTSLLYIDLSGNCIRNRCAVDMFDALKLNATLRYVDLSGNGIADDASESLKNALKANQRLRELNLSKNRLTGHTAKDIAIALEKNTGLRVLRVSGNPLRSRGATIIINALINCKSSAIEELYLNDISVSTDFEKALDELLEWSSSMYVEYGTIYRGGENRKRIAIQKDLVSRILDFIEFRGIRVVDFFRSMDKTGRLMITKEEFKTGLKAAEIPMRASQVDRLFNLMDTEGTGHARYRDFVKLIDKEFHATFVKTRRNHQWNH